MSDKYEVRQNRLAVVLFVMIVLFLCWFFYTIIPYKKTTLFPAASDSVRECIPKIDSAAVKDSALRTTTIDTFPLFNGKLKQEFHDSVFSFRLIFKREQNQNEYAYYSIAAVDIYRLEDQKKIQRIYMTDPFSFYEGFSASQFSILDVNFDGHIDFRVTAGEYINGCRQSGFWLYNSKSGRFEENYELGNTFDTEVDPQSKLVYSVLNMTDGPFGEVRECFSWKNGILYLEHREECVENRMNGDGNAVTLIMGKRINGKFVTRKGDYASAPITKTGMVIYEWDSLK